MPAPNYPTSPSAQSGGAQNIVVFPRDLFSATGNPSTNGGANNTIQPGIVTTEASAGFYTQIQMVPADSILTGFTGQLTGSSGVANPQTGKGIYLPLPWKINDVEMHAWNDLSFFDYIPVISEVAKVVTGAATAIGRAGGYAQGINPFLYMLYRHPMFREFTLNWTLAPNNEQETEILSQICTFLKTAALPEYARSGLALGYPYLALLRLNPNKYLFDFKPCAITQVSVNYAGSGTGPSFFRDGGPTIVNLTLQLKEVEIQVRSDIINSGRGGTITQGLK
jgi:hypothetical protein